ncbi:MAG TPA: GNVR domain-containing protein [Gemmatimonadaceae bacterium]|nr:GNVR domain-containing protein [Gemmatimonadaceae bacterium]
MTRVLVEPSPRSITPLPPAPDGRVFEFSVLRLINAVLRYRALVVALSLLFAFVMALIAFLAARTYTVDTSFIPQTRRVQSQVASIGAQFGIPIANADPTQSSDFYVDLVRSKGILRQVAESTYRFSWKGRAVSESLVDFYAPEKVAFPLRLEKTIERLQSAISAAASPKTGVINLSVKTVSPDLSKQIAAQELQQVTSFNREVRQSQASAERKFTEARVAEAAEELRVAENRLQDFSQRNREFGGSPALGFERDRLNREVVMRQQVYTSLAQAYEQAKIDEVRESSLITVLDPPTAPARPNSRGVITRFVSGLVLGAMLGIFIAILRMYFDRTREVDPDDYGEFAALSRQALDDLKRPWRPAARLFGRPPTP